MALIQAYASRKTLIGLIVAILALGCHARESIYLVEIIAPGARTSD